MVVGKNYSRNNVTGNRKESDFYETPYSMTQHAVDFFNWDRNISILEPANGKGAITKVLRENGFHDIVEFDLEVDFFRYNNNRKFDLLITNPPYSIAHDFIERAKMFSDEVVMLLPLNYLHGKKRYADFYCDTAFPLSDVLVFVSYAMLGQPLREDGKYGTGMVVYAWFRFMRGYKGKPQISWANNSNDVLRVRDL